MKLASGSLLIMILCAPCLADSDVSLSLLATPIPAPQPSPLQRLDLIPDSGPGIQGRAFPGIAYLVKPSSSLRDFAAPRIKPSNAGDLLYNASLISFAALNVADYFSTLAALKCPGVEEKNFLLKFVVKDRNAFAAVKVGFTALTCYSMKALYKKNKPLAWAFSIASNLAYSYVVSNNFRIVHRCKTR